MAGDICTNEYAGMEVKIKCPNCKQQNFTTQETFAEVIHMTVINGVMPDRADDHIPGGVISLHCSCNNCGHYWKPRARQITDLLLADDKKLQKK
jgi:uncharacterized Zn finger protein